MNPSRLFILRPVATSLLMVAILLVGLVAYRFLPISALPEVDYPTIEVTTLYPGASPDVMTSSVTAPLERQFGQMPGLDQMSSASSGGASVITLRFDLDLGLDVAEQEVQAAINAASSFLPIDLPMPPIYSKINPADTPILTLAVTSTTLPLSKVEDLVDTRLAQKLSQLSGVGLVSVGGGLRPAIRIQVNPTALAEYGLNLDDIRTVIGSANVNMAKGSFDGPAHSAIIDANDQLYSADDYSKIIIAWRKGAPIRMGDIANVIDGAENSRLAAWSDKTPAVILNIQRQPGANVIETVDRIKAMLPKLQATLPSTVDVKVLTDRTVTIRASVDDVRFELLISIALVVMVIFLFLRNVSATIIPSVAVPLSLVGTFAVMYLAGFGINNLTLMALTVATGFVVDDAIVMIENISRYIEQGEQPLQAALKGSQQIGFTIISLTFSLIAVLIPLLFMGDVIGRLFREFAITLAVTILISAVVSLTLTPMMCARMLHYQPIEKQSWLIRQNTLLFEKLVARYGVMLNWVLDRQRLTLLVATLTLGLTVLLYILVPKGFFPLQDTGAIQGISEAPQTISFAAMAERQQRLVDVVLQDPAVAGVSSFIGVDGTNLTLNTGRMMINLKPKNIRHASASSVIRRLQPKLAQVAGIHIYMQPVQDMTIEDKVSRTQYQFSLVDANEQELSVWTAKLLARLHRLPELTDIASDVQDKGLQAYVDINRDRAAQFGITPAAIDSALYDAFGQRLVSIVFTQSNMYRVVLEVKPEFQQGIASLNNIYIVPPAGALPVNGGQGPAIGGQGSITGGPGSAASGQGSITVGQAPAVGSQGSATGGMLPLTSVARISEKNTSLVVNHIGQFPATTLSFNLPPGVSLGEAVQAINNAENDMAMPISIQTGFQGAPLAFQASLHSTLWLILAAIITMYIVLGVLYESFIHPVTILSTLPSAAVGALLALMLTGSDLNIIAIIGIILLIGIVKKNAIMMVDFALQAERDEHKTPRVAIFEACMLRFRPILMTTMAALLAALPLMLGTGVGSELRFPLGITMVGGLLVSQVLTLFTTPVIYLTFDKLAQRFKAYRQSPEAT